MRVVNLFAGPGAGKSTTAAGLFHIMKLYGINAELITEYAKELTWDQRFNTLKDQIYVAAKQNRKLIRVQEHVDWAITDSPILLSYYYSNDALAKELCLNLFKRYHNINILVKRVKGYQSVGRTQSLNEAVKIDDYFKSLPDKIPNFKFHLSVAGDLNAPKEIFNFLRSV